MKRPFTIPTWRGFFGFAGLIATFAGTPAFAQFDYAISGFGTIGYARSDSDARYDRFIDDRGTFRRDSILGLQIDAKAWQDFGATVQAKVGPSTTDDHRAEVSVAWAFASWRPTDDWLVRLGKQRIPYYLYSETFDVGASYDFARLPIEMYSITPNNDFVAASVTRTWSTERGEFSLEAAYGKSTNQFRIFSRDTIPSIQERGPDFLKLIFTGGGLIASFRNDTMLVRLTAIHATAHRDGDVLPADYPFVAIAPGVGYYQVSNALPGPGIATTGRVSNTALTGGIDTKLPGQFRLVSEYTHILASQSELSPRGSRGYAALLKRIGGWTPYVYYSFLKSPRSQRDYFTALNDNKLPPVILGAATINASQRAGADQVIAYDQSSIALGTSFALTPTSKLKAEFLRTRVGDVSQLLDVSSGDTPRFRKINTVSLSYSVVFQ